MKKAICKALKNLRHIQNKLSILGDNGVVISGLRDVEAVTISVLESILSFISGPVAESKLSPAVRSCIKSENMKHVENVQKELQSLELSIQDLEEGLETLSK
ncbi:hypothetical protein Gogos_021702, partial [Gossypium gossypioides]|nr:hypothetical protein [Gossypium gossypioides]